MVHRGMVWIAVVLSALVALSFAMFATDQMSGASNHQVQVLDSGNNNIPGSAPAPATHGQPRRFIDGAASNLTSPFDSIVSSGSAWVRHGVPTLVALLVYGIGIGYLARFTRGLQ